MVAVRNPHGQSGLSNPGGPLAVEVGGIGSREVDGSDGGLRVHLALPAGAGPWPGVVLVPAGSNRRLRRRQLLQARRLADRGFVVVIPELSPGPSGPSGSTGVLRRLAGWSSADGRSADDARFARVEAARDWLAGQSACTGAVSVVGLR